MFAEPPGVSYIFPAGGQRGSDVAVRVGGFYFHGRTEFKMTGSGITVSPGLKGADTIWFEGPLIFQPNSQRKEDYPKDHLGKIVIAKDAPLGIRRWHCTTSQGTTPSMHFVIGDLPEVVEHEIDGNPIPQTVKLPVTINGRIFPREDVDIWTIELRKGETLHGRVAAKRLGYPLESVVSVTDPHGRSVSVASRQEHGDPVFSFQAPADGRYQVSINDARYDGMQNYVYRLTLSREPIVGVPAVSGGIAMTSGPEVRETEPNDTVESAKVAPVPATLIGAIQKAGDIDCWKLELTEKQMIAVEVHASQSGSPLDSAITVTDEKGKVVAKGDDQPGGNPDASLRFTAPKAGAYWLNVSDRFAGRGGPDFGYRVTVAPAPANDFQLTVVSDAFTATRIDPLNPPEPPSPKKRYARDSGLRIDALAFGKFNGDIELSVTGLPEGVTIENATLAVKKKFVELQFIAATNAPITVSPRPLPNSTLALLERPAPESARSNSVSAPVIR